MTDSAYSHHFPRLAALLAVGLSLALAACTATPTPALSTATLAPVVSTSTATAAFTATEPPTPTATPVAATATDTALPSATPTATASPTVAATATATVPPATATSAQTIFNTASIWDISSAVDNSGCANPFVPPYGLVQITPSATGLAWHNTVPEDYTFTKIADRTYSYAGPNGIGTGTVTLTVVFNSDTALTLSQTYFSNADPTCAHTYTQTGTFQYFR